MKVNGQVFYTLEKKEDLKELLQNVDFDYLEPLNGELTQVGAWIQDVRPYLSLLEFVRDEFQDIKTLRADNPDILKEFNTIVDELVKLKNEFNKNHEILEKYND